MALEQPLYNDYQVPHFGVPRMLSKRKLLNRMSSRAFELLESEPVRFLFVDCMHGLGNGLQALGSAMFFTNATGRELVPLWEKDACFESEKHLKNFIRKGCRQ